MKIAKIIVFCLFCFCVANAAELSERVLRGENLPKPTAGQLMRLRLQGVKSWILRIGGDTRSFLFNNFVANKLSYVANKLIYKYTESIIRKIERPAGCICPICQELIICAEDKSNVVGSCEKFLLLLKDAGQLESPEKKLIIPLHLTKNYLFRKSQDVHWYHLSCIAEQYFNREDITLEVMETPEPEENVIAAGVAALKLDPDYQRYSAEQLAIFVWENIAQAVDFKWPSTKSLYVKNSPVHNYEKCAVCSTLLSAQERMIIEHYLDSTGPTWITGERYNPNWIFEYSNQVLKKLTESVRARRLEPGSLYEDFCQAKHLPEIEEGSRLVAYNLLAKIPAKDRIFNLMEEKSKQEARRKYRYNFFGFKVRPELDVPGNYEIFMRPLEPYFRGDLNNAIEWFERVARFKTKKINQLPAIYSTDLHESEVLLKFFKYVFALNWNKSFAELTVKLNDRIDFGNFLAEKSKVFTNPQIQRKIIEGDISSVQSEASPGWSAINNFVQGAEGWPFFIWIFPMPEKEYPEHKICILVRKNQQQKVEFIIADSLGKDRCRDPKILELYQKYFTEK